MAEGVGIMTTYVDTYDLDTFAAMLQEERPEDVPQEGGNVTTLTFPHLHEHGTDAATFLRRMVAGLPESLRVSLGQD
jgi:hypothetical protein